MSPLDGDGPCSTCGTTENVVWFTDDVFWNAVVRSDLFPWGGLEPILCISCFVKQAEDVQGYRPTAWRFVPAWRWEQVRTDGHTSTTTKGERNELELPRGHRP